MEMTDRSELLKLGIPGELIDEILKAGVLAIIVRSSIPNDNGWLTVGQYRPLFNVIKINRDVNREDIAEKLSIQSGMEISPSESATFILLHEYGHFLDYKSEEMACAFAIMRLEKLRERRRRAESISAESIKALATEIFNAVKLGQEQAIKQAFREALRR